LQVVAVVVRTADVEMVAEEVAAMGQLAHPIHISNNMKLLLVSVVLVAVVVVQLTTDQFMVMLCLVDLALLLFVTVHLVTPE
jgi:hypothetical protein